MTVQRHAVNDIGVAVDVGSTSIGVCCVDLSHKTELLSFSFANPQHIYGVDVVTRIKHCMDAGDVLHKMHMLVEKELHAKLHEYLGEAYFDISNIVYSGNTTMLHILREMSVEGLATAPFRPVNIDYHETKGLLEGQNEDENGKNYGIIYSYLPGFSAFVGADILSGATYLQMGRSENYDLLIDLGTNGEMLLLNKEKGFATSTACGPVFDHVINGAKYGSDSIKVIANCVKRGLIDETGKLADALFEKGISIDNDFVIKQEHIRNFQLAKGAIYAGIQCLLDKAKIKANDIAKVYISGGLGFHMNIRDAFTLKMLPEELKNKVEISGNTSLEGAKQFLMSKNMEENLPDKKCTDESILQEYDSVRNRTESFELANQEGFQECFMKSLDFI